MRRDIIAAMQELSENRAVYQEFARSRKVFDEYASAVQEQFRGIRDVQASIIRERESAIDALADRESAHAKRLEEWTHIADLAGELYRSAEKARAQVVEVAHEAREAFAAIDIEGALDIARRLEAAEQRQRRRRSKLEEVLLENPKCRRQNCAGTLGIADEEAGGAVVTSALVCKKCGYERLESPEYPEYRHADGFLEIADGLKGTPALPACYNAHQACELYLRELGGTYHYMGREDNIGREPDFVPPTRDHGLGALWRRLGSSRRERLGGKALGTVSFRETIEGLPRGLWAFLRYEEVEALKRGNGKERAAPTIEPDGRLYVDGIDIYSALTAMGRVLKGFIREEYRRNIDWT